MTDNDKKHFADMLQGLSAAIGKGGEVTKGVLMVYWTCMREIPLADFDRAIEKAAQGTHDWFPSVADLRELAGHKKKGPTPLYLRPVENELERIETCSFHVAQGGTKISPSYVPWCRKCRRLKVLAEPQGGTAAVGDMLRLLGMVEPKP